MLLGHDAIDEDISGPRVAYLFWHDEYEPQMWRRLPLANPDTPRGPWVLASDGQYPSTWEPVC